MTISIVTPTFNGARYLKNTINSVIAQNYTEWEHVIVDDGSSDNTVDIARCVAKNEPRIRVFQQENAGVANARNLGYCNISPSSKYVIFLDQDDVWKPETLTRLLEALESSPDAVGAHGLTRQTDLAGNPIGSPEGTIMSRHRRKLSGKKIVFCPPSEPTTFSTLICDCCIPTPGVTLIKRKAFERIKMRDRCYFDQAVASGDDWDVWLRLSLRGPIAFVNEVLLDWTIHDSNGSKNEYVTLEAESKVRAKMSTWPELNEGQRSIANWRFHSISASIERQNATACWRWMLSSLRIRQWKPTAKLARTWCQTYFRYLGLKLLWRNNFPQKQIPSRLVNVRQILEMNLPVVRRGASQTLPRNP